MDHQHELNEEAPVAVVVVPLPAQGHLNQLLHFACQVSTRRIPVHYVGSASHNRQAKQRIHGWDFSSISNIHFHDFPLPPFQTPPPDPHASNKFPAHLQPTFDGTKHLREPLSKLLQSLSLTSRRIIVVHDAMMLFAAEEASYIPNAEAYRFNMCSAFSVLVFRWKRLGKPKNFEGTEILSELPSFLTDGCFTDEFGDFIASQSKLLEFDTGDLYNTCHPIEGKFLEVLSEEIFAGERKQWAIGPLNPVKLDYLRGSVSNHKCLEWLDRQPQDSVLYVSFGTMTSISDKQITELAVGLEQSEQRFIWVLREADRGDIFAGEEVRKNKLPDGFEKRVEGLGIVVRDWAPQLHILAHRSTGGFLSHCGWNSCMESLSMGVPIAAWPMHSDQPANTVLVTKVLKVGVVVKEWGSEEEVVSSRVIESALRKLMVSEEGKDMRKRAEELGVAVRQAVSEDGSATAELDSFLAHICKQKEKKMMINQKFKIIDDVKHVN